MRHGSLEWLVNQWKQSADWLLSSPATQRQRENILDRVLADNGTVSFSKITAEHVRKGRDKRIKTPAAANNFIKTLRALFRWASDPAVKHAKSNPAQEVKLIPLTGEGHTPWTREDVQRFRDHWPLGTMPRLALEIYLWTGLRRGDAARLGRQHIRDGVISMRTEKRGRHKAEGVQLDLPVLPPLREAIDAMPVQGLTLITGKSGRPLVKETLGNLFAEWCADAGVDARAHGIRKLAASMAAESGATEKELQAWFGWITNTQSRLYTERADRARLAKSAAEKLGADTTNSRTLEPVREPSQETQPNQELANGTDKAGGRYWTRSKDSSNKNNNLLTCVE